MIPDKFTYPFCYEPHLLSRLAAEGVIDYIKQHPSWLPVLQEGKMFGVLVAEKDGEIGYLAAYSGQMSVLDGDPFFVPPVFDYLQPDGYFKREEAEISAINERIKAQDDDAEALRLERKQRSQALQRWLFGNFVMLNAKGESRNLLDIFEDTPMGFPPSGAGECCAPKLLQYAYQNGYRPVCMAEFWWGDSPKTEIRHHLQFYPSCRGRCLPILTFMMQGLDVEDNPQESITHDKIKIVYEDDYIVVIDKPSGMLSVPGRVERPSALSELKELYNEDILLAHRLDMDTSGLLVAAKDADTYRNLQQQFLDRTVKKRYRAIVLPKDISTFHVGDKGTIDLPLSPDYIERPCQRVDFEHGKRAITEWRVDSINAPEVTLLLFPHTGRTHQLRVHCASPHGLNAPIKGDPLYGKRADRLHLYAEYLEFTHPIGGKRMRFTTK